MCLFFSINDNLTDVIPVKTVKLTPPLKIKM